MRTRSGKPANPVVMVLIGAVFVAAGWLFVKPEVISNPEVTTGEVTEVRESYSSSRKGGGGTKYSPIISYTVDGQRYTYDEPSASSSKVSVGEQVEIEYDAKNPQNARWTGSAAGWAWLLFVGLGAVFVLGGIALWIRRLTM